MRGLQWNINYNIFHFRLFSGKTKDKVFQKMQKTIFLTRFTHFWANRTFIKILFWLVVFILTKDHFAKLKKTNVQIPSNTGFSLTDAWADKRVQGVWKWVLDFQQKLLLYPKCVKIAHFWTQNQFSGTFL